MGKVLCLCSVNPYTTPGGLVGGFEAKPRSGEADDFPYTWIVEIYVWLTPSISSTLSPKKNSDLHEMHKWEYGGAVTRNAAI